MSIRICGNCDGLGNTKYSHICPYCDGTGEVTIKMRTCPDCGGDGFMLDENDEMFDCEYCKGEGEIEDE